jgi:LAS superfamily LD-carboxypeptidase LdcB
MPAGYAAVPGTSNHGWGLAVDLCGGIQVDYSPEHEWLMDHAAEFSWFHPSWALPGGPGPHEPWHWEFAG